MLLSFLLVQPTPDQGLKNLTVRLRVNPRNPQTLLPAQLHCSKNQIVASCEL